mgnify:CR=1 FL=1
MTDLTAITENEIINLTIDVVSAYVSHNPVPALELPALIADVHAAIKGLRPTPELEVEEKALPAVSARKSITPDFLICLEDGKKFKSLKRHLATHHNLTPDEYRQKWNLAADYPMVSPSYSNERSVMAKSMGLGRKRALSEESAKTVTPANRKKIGLKFA